ncbi:MAG: oligosaccharide flippase family protein, partial [Clostridia bacterium]|nr:oligosaccharide flippase family protein [Clostridia bacterium]
MKRTERFLLNGTILSASSVLMRSIGVFFSVFISNRIGADGVGLYTLIMSVYSFAVTLATSGVNTASTRLVAEELAKGPAGNSRKAMRACLLYALGFGTLTLALLFFGAELIGTRLLDDVRTVRSLQALSLSMPAIAVSSALSGYFLAVRRVLKSASSQLLEQLLKIGLSIGLLSAWGHRGIEHACL